MPLKRNLMPSMVAPIPAVPAPGNWRQEDEDFKVVLTT